MRCIRHDKNFKTAFNPVKPVKTSLVPTDLDACKDDKVLRIKFSILRNKLFLTFALSLSLLEQKMLEMEMRHREELESLRQEKGSLQTLVGSQSGVIRELEAQLSRATGNSTALQRQQQEMMDTVHNLLNLCSKDGGKLLGIGAYIPGGLELFQQFKL